MDIAIVGGTVVDGTGAPRVRADFGITDDRIVAVGELRERAGRTIDAAGRIVAPGFIDAHAHSDFVLLRNPQNPEKVLQGVTTNIIGNCALSPAPVNGTVRLFFENLLQHVLGPVEIRWAGFAELLRVYETEGVAPNLKSLAGQGTIRMAVMGMESRPPDAREMQAMQRHLSAAMEAGAIGVSTASAPQGAADRPGRAAGRLRVWRRATRTQRGGAPARIARGRSASAARRCGGAISTTKVEERPNGAGGSGHGVLDAARDSGLAIDCDVCYRIARSGALPGSAPQTRHISARASTPRWSGATRTSWLRSAERPCSSARPS
jgi:hypothetical protein